MRAGHSGRETVRSLLSEVVLSASQLVISRAPSPWFGLFTATVAVEVSGLRMYSFFPKLRHAYYPFPAVGLARFSREFVPKMPAFARRRSFSLCCLIIESVAVGADVPSFRKHFPAL